MNRTQHSELGHSAPEAPQRPSTILLVDDVDQLRELVSKLLRNGGYTVLEAENGKACSKLIQEYPGPIHLLLADMFLPGMSGRKVADYVRMLRKETKILFMSGRSNEEIFGHAGLYPGAGFLAKPFTPETLLRKVAETLGA
jgi:two-component system, cell cycle sensor histidine kinase and response regulator CckA